MHAQPTRSINIRTSSCFACDLKDIWVRKSQHGGYTLIHYRPTSEAGLKDNKIHVSCMSSRCVAVLWTSFLEFSLARGYRNLRGHHDSCLYQKLFLPSSFGSRLARSGYWTMYNDQMGVLELFILFFFSPFYLRAFLKFKK